jgi:hypothetical protein
MTIPDSTPLDGYKSEAVQLHYLSDLSPPEAEHLIGRTIVAVIGTEYGLAVTCDDGSVLAVVGNTYGGCALDVSVDLPDEFPDDPDRTLAPPSSRHWKPSASSRRLAPSPNPRSRNREANELEHAMSEEYEPIGLHFIDLASGRLMCLVSEGPYAGWLCYKQNWPGGSWVTLRIATDEDRKALNLPEGPSQ